MSMDINQAKESIRKISELEYSVLLPGHGATNRTECVSDNEGVRYWLLNIMCLRTKDGVHQSLPQRVQIAST